MCFIITGVISLFEMFGSFKLAAAMLTTTGRPSPLDTEKMVAVTLVASPLAHLSRNSHIYNPSIPIFMTCSRKSLRQRQLHY